MGVKAKLKISLCANDVVVAESDDTDLWNRVFSAIAAGSTEGLSLLPKDVPQLPDTTSGSGAGKKAAGGATGKFAEELGVSNEELVGACGPIEEAPYIQMDEKYWETLRGHTGSRGKNAVAPVAFATTLLALWSKHRSDSTIPTATEARAVLKTIHLEDKNPSRSLKNCEWLQQRSGGWVINPAMRSRALKLVKAYVLLESPGE